MFITKDEQLVDNALGQPPYAWLPLRAALTGRMPRVLGIDPGTRLMGVSVLDGDELLYYAVKELRKMRPAFQLSKATSDVVSELVERYQPQVLAFETSYYIQQRSSPLLQRQEHEIRRRGKALGLRVIAYSPLYVRQQLCADAYVTKHMVARVLVARFPELARYRANQTPRSERYWLNMFDALAVAVVAAREVMRDENATGAEPDLRAA